MSAAKAKVFSATTSSFQSYSQNNILQINNISTKNERSRKNLLNSLTTQIISTFEICSPSFKAFEVKNIPQRVLTIPSESVSNDGQDNEEANLICKVQDKLIPSPLETNNNSNASNNFSNKIHPSFSECTYHYTVLDLLGTGTFGQVFRCQRSDTKQILAVKIVKNKPAYHSQALLEIRIASLLNSQFDPEDERHIVRLLESFKCKNHVCLVFELLSMSLLGTFILKLSLSTCANIVFFSFFSFQFFLEFFSFFNFFFLIFFYRCVDSESVSRASAVGGSAI
jgi:hypothetical protein